MRHCQVLSWQIGYNKFTGDLRLSRILFSRMANCKRIFYMLTLVLAVAVAVIVSFLCSLAEAALYAIPWSAIENLRKSGKKSGELLFKMRSNVDKPIAAILTLNTVANTAGSTIAGGAFLAVFGPGQMAIFATSFTIIILAFGEIVPKTLGVAKATPIARMMARPLLLTVKILAPVLWCTSLLTRLLSQKNDGPQVSEDDIRAIASLSRQAGRIKPYEESFVRNVLSLDQKRVYEIMTPRTVVFSLPETLTVEEAYKLPQIWHFSRIPVYGENNEDLVGLVERRTLGQCYADGKTEARLGEITRPLHFVLESMRLDLLLRDMLKERVHLYAVIDEYGGLAGVVSLEDILEEILGSEIMDESDNVADLRALAREKRKALKKQEK